ncbi:transporter substrate-binding domain-containing protein [Psychrobacillus sp. INOP01]|uniref:transporter substrate-binding domain-containing protein n=1 Tax=Psychrobacillus sp. INOP01 TaxID=2829187 RepID=UPI001BA53A93|nr:transporter substrate-binding domain-containing protein [Psychrobacillus sp. INOP01]QUG39979.1 transporter substrate-binding domain-containing protein [Psychrobacillus sp. INOP01]
MKLKKILSLLFILCISILLAACGDDSEKTSAGNKDGVSTDKKVLRVGSSGIYPPFISVDDKGVPQGYDVEVLELVTESLGYEIEWTFAEFSGIFGMLDAGNIDTVSNLIAATEERRAKYDFSSPYAYSGASLVVPEDNTDINSIEDLKGKKVGVLLGNNLHQFLEKWNEENGKEIIITPYQDVSGTYNEVALGRLDAFIDVKITAASRIKDEGLPLKLYGEDYLIDFDYAFPFVRSEENKEFLADFSAEIEKLQEDGTLKKLSDKWSAIDVTIPHEK